MGTGSLFVYGFRRFRGKENHICGSVNWERRYTCTSDFKSLASLMPSYPTATPQNQAKYSIPYADSCLWALTGVKGHCSKACCDIRNQYRGSEVRGHCSRAWCDVRSQYRGVRGQRSLFKSIMGYQKSVSRGQRSEVTVQEHDRISEVGIEGEGVPDLVWRHHAHLLVLADPLLKEVGLAFQRDVLHEVKGILSIIQLGARKS